MLKSTDWLDAIATAYPRYATRYMAAEIITRHLYPIKARSLERWQQPATVIVAGRAVADTRDWLAAALAQVPAAN